MPSERLEHLPDEQLIRIVYADWGPHRDAAFAVLEARWRLLLVRFLRRLGFSPDVAEGLALAVLFRVYRTRCNPPARYRPEKGASFSTWIHQIAQNVARDEWRRRGRRVPEVAGPVDVPDDWWEAVAASDQPLMAEHREPDPEGTVVDEEWIIICGVSALRGDLYDCIDRLPQRQHQIILMDLQEELSQKEIAEILDCSEANVSQRKRRSLQNLRRCLRNKGYLIPEEDGASWADVIRRTDGASTQIESGTLAEPGQSRRKPIKQLGPEVEERG